MTQGRDNSICDIPGLNVGNAHDDKLKSGVTVLLPDKPVVASVAVHGGAPGTRESDLLAPENSVDAVDSIVLSGGSAFGLDAASGVQAWLREHNRGFEVGPVRIPIVPSAILFDLINAGEKDWGRYPPYRELGYAAADAARPGGACGSLGAGYGALVAGLKGGLGTASCELPNGIIVASLVAVNAVGSPLIGKSPNFHATLFEKGDEFGGLGLPDEWPVEADNVRLKHREFHKAGTNTTIGVVATNVALTKAEAKRLAVSAHDGIARAIWPAHTPMDGDLVYGITTGDLAEPLTGENWAEMGAAAASTMARAIARAVYNAAPAENDLFPCWKEAFG